MAGWYRRRCVGRGVFLPQHDRAEAGRERGAEVRAARRAARDVRDLRQQHRQGRQRRHQALNCSYHVHNLINRVSRAAYRIMIKFYLIIVNIYKSIFCLQ